MCLVVGLKNTDACCAVDREALSDLANVYSYQSFVETDKAGYVIRQWVASSLYDRIRCVQLLAQLYLSAHEQLWVHLAHDPFSP